MQQKTERIVERAERRNQQYMGGAKDFADILIEEVTRQDVEIKIDKQSFNFPDNAKDSELEILDVRDVKQ